MNTKYDLGYQLLTLVRDVTFTLETAQKFNTFIKKDLL